MEFFAGELSVRFSRTDPLLPLLVREFARTDLEALQSLERRNRGEPVSTSSAPTDAPIDKAHQEWLLLIGSVVS